MSLTSRTVPWDWPWWGPTMAPLGWVYGSVTQVRRWAYRRGTLSRTRFSVPVVSVGNLTVGGVGKTPFVSALLSWLPAELGPALVLSRGYGAAVEHDGVTLNDEGQMLKRRHPGHRFAEGGDRAAAAARATMSDGDPRVIILDDGAQHLRVERDLDIQLFDVASIAAPRRVLPAGPWREPLCAARSADAFVLTHCDQVPRRESDDAAAVLAELAPSTPVFRSRHALSRLVSLGSEESIPVAALDGARVGLISGIGSPGTFENTVAGAGAEVVWRLDFPDHHAYGHHERGMIEQLATSQPVDMLVTTEKDALKLPMLADHPVFALIIDMDFGDDRKGLFELIGSGLQSARKVGG